MKAFLTGVYFVIALFALAIASGFYSNPATAQTAMPIDRGQAIINDDGTITLRFENLKSDSCAWVDRSAPATNCTNQVVVTDVREVTLKPDSMKRKRRVKTDSGTREMEAQ